MGPYELMDYIGLDVSITSLVIFLTGSLGTTSQPPGSKLRLTLVSWGRRRERAFTTGLKARPEIDLSRAKEDFDPDIFTALQANEATKLLEEGVVKSSDEIDKAMVNGGGAALGPFQLAREIGYDKLARICDELAKKFGVKVFEPTETLKGGSP